MAGARGRRAGTPGHRTLSAVRPGRPPTHRTGVTPAPDWQRSRPRSWPAASVPDWWPGGSSVARERRASFADQEYWGRPVPVSVIPGPGSWWSAWPPLPTGPTAPAGSSPATVPVTGFRRSLPGRPGQPADLGAADDGLALTDVYISAAVRCAPPQNKPTPGSGPPASPYLRRELSLYRGHGGRGPRRFRLRRDGRRVRPPAPSALRSPGAGSGLPRTGAPSWPRSIRVSRTPSPRN